MTEEHRLVESVEVTDTGIHIIQLKSVLDASTVDEFEQVLGFLITQNNYKFIVDLTRIDFISSAGWGVFIGELKKIRTHQGDIKLVGMQPDVYDVFLLLELDTLIEAFETLDEALISFGVEPAETAQESADAALEGGADAAGISEEQAMPTETEENAKFVDSAAEPELPANNAQPASDFTQSPAETPGETEAEETAELDAALSREAMDETDEVSPQPGADISVQSRDILPAANAEETREQEILPNPFDINEIADPWLGEDGEEGILLNHLQGDLVPGAGEPLDSTQLDEPSVLNDINTTVYGQQKLTPAERRRRRRFNPSIASNHHGNAAAALQELDGEATAGDEDRAIWNRKLANLSEDPLLEKIISVVIAHPSYGPSSIRKMLIEMNLVEAPLSRSMVYRKLTEVNLNTRAKRRAFAQAQTL